MFSRIAVNAEKVTRKVQFNWAKFNLIGLSSNRYEAPLAKLDKAGPLITRAGIKKVIN